MNAGVIRTWQCQSERCARIFDSWDRYPTCPDCGNVRTSWVPGAVNVGNAAAKLDATLRDLADAFSLTNLRSAKAGERAKPSLPAPAPSGPQINFAPGFSAPLTPNAACLPSTTKVDFKVKAGLDRKRVPNGAFAQPSANTVFVK